MLFKNTLFSKDPHPKDPHPHWAFDVERSMFDVHSFVFPPDYTLAVT
jgi:hypothetical protein